MVDTEAALFIRASRVWRWSARSSLNSRQISWAGRCDEYARRTAKRRGRLGPPGPDYSGCGRRLRRDHTLNCGQIPLWIGRPGFVDFGDGPSLPL